MWIQVLVIIVLSTYCNVNGLDVNWVERLSLKHTINILEYHMSQYIHTLIPNKNKRNVWMYAVL